MEIYRLKVFRSVYEKRSFSAASAELNLTQPSVSMHIKKLEEELGVRLFDRIGRKTVPTKEAERLYERAGEIIEKLDGIKEEVSPESRKVEGIIAVSTNTAVGAYIFPALAAEFKKIYTDVYFNMSFEKLSKILESISSGELMLGIVDENKDRADIECLHTIDDELILIARPGFIGKKAITPFGLFKIPLLIREDGSEARKSMEREHMMRSISLKALNVTAILGSTDSIKEAVKAGLGASILSRFAVRDELSSGAMEEIRIRGVRMRRKLYVVANRKRAMPEHYRKFVEFIAEKIPSCPK